MWDLPEPDYEIWKLKGSYNEIECVALMLNLDPGFVTDEWLWRHTNVVVNDGPPKDDFTHLLELLQKAVTDGALKPLENDEKSFAYENVRSWLLSKNRNFKFFTEGSDGQQVTPSEDRNSLVVLGALIQVLKEQSNTNQSALAASIVEKFGPESTNKIVGLSQRSVDECFSKANTAFEAKNARKPRR